MSTVSHDGRNHLAPGILRMIDSSVSWKDLHSGNTLVIQALDAATRQLGEVRLIVVDFQEVNNIQVPTFVIVAPDFNFHSGGGGFYGTVPDGTLCTAGVCCALVPTPRLSFINIGGVDHRDLSLEHLDGTDQSVIIGDIKGLEVRHGQPEIEVPNDLSEFYQKIKDIPGQEPISRPQMVAELKMLLADTYHQQLPEKLEADLLDCHPAGISAIGGLLKRAARQQKFDQAVAAIQIALYKHWSFQHPDIRANPIVGSNADDYARISAELGLTSDSAQNIEYEIESPGGELSVLRDYLRAEPGPEWESLDELSITDQAPGTIVVVETRSGNRYALKIINPTDRTVDIAGLYYRDIDNDRGFWEGVRTADLAIGMSLKNPFFITSSLQKIWRVLVPAA